jgi:hypothetical protein
MNRIRAAKYLFRGASLIVEILILLIVAAPILGAVTPQIAPQNELGLGVNLQTINSQLQFLNSSTTIAGAHTVTIPAFNRWFLPGSVALSLSLTRNGTILYQTARANLTLAPFQSGALDLTFNIPSKVISEMESRGGVSGGGQMTLQEGPFWSITVNLGKG